MHQVLDVEVKEGGKIEIVLPDLRLGEVVRVTIDSPPTVVRERPFGLLRGKIRIHDNFDDPLEEFEPYT
jgi:hypothetical protein